MIRVKDRLLTESSWIFWTVFHFHINNCLVKKWFGPEGQLLFLFMRSWPKPGCSGTVTAWNHSLGCGWLTDSVEPCETWACPSVHEGSPLCWRVCVSSALLIRRGHRQQRVPGALQQGTEGQCGEPRRLSCHRRSLVSKCPFWLFYFSSAFCFLPISIPISRLTSRTLANPRRIISAAPTEEAASCLTLTIWAFQIWTL